MERFSLGLAYEMREHNISVVAVQPGMVKTEGAEVVYPKDFDWTGWQDPLDAAKAFVWLAQQTAETFTMRVVRSPRFRDGLALAQRHFAGNEAFDDAVVFPEKERAVDIHVLGDALDGRHAGKTGKRDQDAPTDDVEPRPPFAEQ